jgi:type VI secretion system secreted protein VgrG
VSTAKSCLVSAKEAVRLFAYRAGMKLVAAKADIDIQALQRSANFVAKLNITHTADCITLTAEEEIVVNGGGSYTAWRSGGIDIGTPGAWVSHAATHAMVKPANLNVAPMTLPTALFQPEPGSLRFDVWTQPDGVAGAALAAEPYQLLKGAAVIDQGLTNEQGQVVVNNHQPGTTTYQVRLSDGTEHELRVSDALDRTSEHGLANQGYRTATHHRDRATGNGLDNA